MWPGNICDWGIKENPTEERPNTFVVYLPEGAKPGDVVEVTNEFGDKVVTRVPKVRVSVCQCAGINKINNWLTNVSTPPLIPAGTPVHEGPAQIARIQGTPDCGQAEGRRGNRDALLDGGNSQLRRGRNHVRGAARPHRGRAARRQRRGRRDGPREGGQRLGGGTTGEGDGRRRQRGFKGCFEVAWTKMKK